MVLANGSRDPAGALLSCVGWVLLIVIATVVLVLVALSLKKRYSNDDGGGGDIPVGGFMVGDLRRMRDRGEISDEEYERARERIVTAAKQLLAKDTEKAGDPDRPPPDAPHTKNLDLIRDAET